MQVEGNIWGIRVRLRVGLGLGLGLAFGLGLGRVRFKVRVPRAMNVPALPYYYLIGFSFCYLILDIFFNDYYIGYLHVYVSLGNYIEKNIYLGCDMHASSSFMRISYSIRAVACM
jgi:hypothetical protein